MTARGDAAAVSSKSPDASDSYEITIATLKILKTLWESLSWLIFTLSLGGFLNLLFGDMAISI